VTELNTFLRSQASADLLSWHSHVAAVERFGLSHAEVEHSALVLGLLPSRYQRNRNAISVEEQLTLFRSRVAVIGCGGLGGYVIEQLARLGVGTIVAIDPDRFEEHNLNRQLLATPGALGQPKVAAAAQRVAEINPAVTLVAEQTAYAPENGGALLAGVNVVVDALDSIPTRLALAKTCAKLDVPLIHGAIAGWYGQVTTQFPGDTMIESMYSRWTEGKGAESQLGNPAFTPAVIASIETAEVCKVLLRVGSTLRSRKLVVNLFDMSFDEIVFESQGVN
jgi:molybdopterin/thiamine biosynthesis adenylyltransferase